MNSRDLARFFVRFQALCLVFYALIEFLDFPRAWRNFQKLREYHVSDAPGAEDFRVTVARIALYLGAAVILFGWTDKVVDLFTKGRGSTSPADGGAPAVPPTPGPAKN